MGRRARRSGRILDELELLRMLRSDGRPIGLPGPAGVPGDASAAHRLRDRGLIRLWPGRGWVLTEAGHRLHDELMRRA